MDIDFFEKFKDCISKLASIGEDYALAKAQSWQFQELCSVIRSEEFKKFPDLSIAKAEAESKTSERYIKHLEITKDSIHKELSLKAQYEAQKSRFEALRSLSSLEKSTRALIE